MIYIVIILLMRVVQHVFNKRSSNEITGNRMFLKFLTIRQLISAIPALILVALSAGGLAQLKADGLTLLLSLMMAVTLALSTFAGIMSMKSGTMVLSSLFSMAGLFVPCIAGVFLFDEKISLLQVGGLAVFIFSAYLLIGCSRKLYSNFSVKTLLLLLLGMLANGTTMLIQKLFAYYVPQGSAGVFNFYGFFFSAALSLVLYTVFSIKKDGLGEKDARISGKLLLAGVALSVAVFVISQCATVASATIPSVILFPVGDGGGMIICAVVSALMYGEKLTKNAVIGLILGTLSLIIINLG